MCIKEGEARFGEQYNSSTASFECWWAPAEGFVLELPVKLSTVRFNQVEAQKMRDALNRFLEESGK